MEKIIPKKLQTLTSNNSENSLKMQSSPINNQLNTSVSSNSTIRSENSGIARAVVKHKYNAAKYNLRTQKNFISID